MRNTQDCIEDEMQANYEWQDRQVWCARCEEHVREMDRNERHPLPDEFCAGCQEDIEMEARAKHEKAVEAMRQAVIADVMADATVMAPAHAVRNACGKLVLELDDRDVPAAADAGEVVIVFRRVREEAA